MHAEASFICGSKQSFTSLISLDILRSMRKLTTFIALLAALSFGNTAFADEADNKTARAPVETPTGIQRYATAAQELVIQGMSYLGIPYRYGGTDRESGVDCSGLVQNLFRSAIGLDLPRTAAAMSKIGEEVERSELRPGDLVFFNTMRRAFSHVGIYLGDGRFLHSPSTGGAVRIEKLSVSYWASRFNGARRILPDHQADLVTPVGN